MKKLISTILFLTALNLCFAGYTKVSRGDSLEITITGSSTSLRQLIIDAGGSAIDPKINRVLVSVDGDPAAVVVAARFSNDPLATISAGTGRALISLEERIFTIAQFDTILIAEAGSIVAWVEQYDSEQNRN